MLSLHPSAPDSPDVSGSYPMAAGTDYAQQTAATNLIDDSLITELTRIVCYNQTIYDDSISEGDEYLGLSLAIIDDSTTTVVTQVKPSFDQAVIRIVDDEGKELMCTC